MASVSIAIDAQFGLSYAGLLSQVGYVVRDSVGTLKIARTTTGITERLDGSDGTGIYEATIVCDTAWGDIRVIWDFYPDYPGVMAEETISTGNAFLGGVPGTAPDTSGLTTVQKRLYRDTATVYRLSEVVDGPTGSAKASYAKVYENIACLFWTTDNFADNSKGGPIKEASLMTSDRWKFAVSIVLHTNDLIILTTTGRQDTLSAHIAQGEIRIKPFPARVAHCQVYSAPTTMPKGVTL